MNETFQSLLVVQDHDIAIDQLQYRRDHLPARAEFDAALAEAKELMPRHQDLTKRSAEIGHKEKRIDDEVQLQRAKADEVNTKLYSGTVTASKELQALQADLDSIRAHISTLEDDELEVMSAREELDAELETVAKRLDALQREVQRCQAVIAEGEREVDALLVTARAERDEIAATIDPGLVRDYDARRAQNRGFGAARLIGDTCQACRLSIPATEVDAIRMDVSGKAWYCDNCGAILVVTPA